METKTRADIPGFEGLYYVTSDGDVYNARRGKKIKIRRKPHNGRCVVMLSKGGVAKEYSMSWIMRMCFFNGAPGRIMHKDMCKSNFSLQNIKLTTQSEISARNRGSRYKTVVHKKPDGTEDIYRSAADAAKALYVSSSSIISWCNKKCKNTLIDGEFYYEDERYQ